MSIPWDIAEKNFNPALPGQEKEITLLTNPDRGKALMIPFISTAIEALVEVAQNSKAYAPARVAAANSILDRAYGRPEALTPPPPPPPEGVGVLLITTVEEKEAWLNKAISQQ